MPGLNGPFPSPGRSRLDQTRIDRYERFVRGNHAKRLRQRMWYWKLLTAPQVGLDRRLWERVTGIPYLYQV